jgi:hypothetical protein
MVMAIPIGATPVLTGKEAAEFIKMIHKDAQKPASLTPTPKLGKARELIKKHAEGRQKYIR